ncbi:MAG: colanic acid biosynthesis glycosyltransferase WcaL [Nitrospirae bacterium RBG_13_39_12]|nr:MAG: colanic acid biosynthesis glycosyltransferase WcaL [Nitrospirae bacterium RBG_13_39_12]
MKIAFIVNAFPTLTETFILNQITGLLDLGHDVEIFAGHTPSEEKVHTDVKKYCLTDRVHYFFGDLMPSHKIKRVLKAIPIIIKNFHKDPLNIMKSLNVYKYGIRALSLLLFYSRNYFLKKEFDIVHCHYGPNGIFGVYLKETGIRSKIVTSFYGFDISEYLLREGDDIYKNLFQKGDFFLPICQFFKRKLISLNCDERKIFVHNMGIDLKRYRYSERIIRSKENIKILTLARLDEKKGHEYAIKAIAKVIKKHKNIHYIIAGGGTLRSELESLVSELDIKKHVNFLGAIEQSEALVLYQQAHIFVLHSITASNGDQEGTPIVLLEAQAMGLPVISTYHSAIPEVVVDGKSGFLVPEKDVNALAEKLEYLIEHPEMWSEMGRNGRRIIEEKYDISKSNKRLAEIYQRLHTGMM